MVILNLKLPKGLTCSGESQRAGCWADFRSVCPKGLEDLLCIPHWTVYTEDLIYVLNTDTHHIDCRVGYQLLSKRATSTSVEKLSLRFIGI
jgi:hypothetical protein